MSRGEKGLMTVKVDGEEYYLAFEPLKNIKEDPAQIWIDKLKIELVRLGLKIIEDINDRRVSKPEETYNSLVALYNAVK